MSRNLTLHAKRDVVVVKTGKESKQVVTFELWQTPTNVTYACLESSDPETAYCDWCRTQPYGGSHIAELKRFIGSSKSAGYEIEWGLI